MGKPHEPTVFVVDDDAGVRKAVTRLLRAAGYRAEAYASAQELAGHVDPTRAGCLILDLSMPKIGGLELQGLLREEGCALPIVFLTGHGDVAASVAAMKAGAVDFLMKPARAPRLLAAVQEALARDVEARYERERHAQAGSRLATLSPREREVLELVVSGRLNKQIAGELGTTEKTIKVHRARAMVKMGATSLADLVRVAQLAGVPSAIA
jgi:FixJ family two-component response regulator